MKKKTILFLVMTLLLSCTACASNETAQETAAETVQKVVEETEVETVPVDEKPAGDGEGGYRISRNAEEEEIPQARHAVKTASETEEEE